MKADLRRKEIVSYMLSENNAVSGTKLAELFGVSRQIIVQDISILKASGYEILSTNKGYIMHKTPLCERVFKLFHTKEQTKSELSTIVELGGTVVDVYVWHKVYGRVVAKLYISTKHHVEQFIEGVTTGKSSELMDITGGYHYHTVSAESEDILDKIEQALKNLNLIVPEI